MGKSGIGVGGGKIYGTTITKHISINKVRNGRWTTESVDSVGEYIKGISVVERLGTKKLVKISVATHRLTVVYVSIGLDNP